MRAVLLACGVAAMAGSAWGQMEIYQSRTLLEKTLYYVSQGKIGQCKYWSLHLGRHDVVLRRKFPGEDTIDLQASMNLALISSGYISGNGYSAKGKVDCLTGFFFADEDTSFSLPLDSIEYAYQNLNMVKTNRGAVGYLRVDVEGKLVRPKSLLLTIYKMVDHYGEKVLRKSADINISAFAHTKEGIRKALAASRAAGG
jgi:hypothetical protein